MILFRDQRFKGGGGARSAAGPGGAAGFSADQLPPCQSAASSSQAICSGVELARELVAAPQLVTPAALAESAATIAQDFGLQLKVLERAECEALEWAYLAVAQGLTYLPKFIHSPTAPKEEVKRRLVLVAKA